MEMGAVKLKVEELRIGNIINGLPITLDDMMNMWHNGTDGWNPEPITIDWLSRMGLHKKDNDFGKFNNVSLGGGCISINYERNGNQFLPRREIQFVHDLQNTFFAMFEHELTIKPQDK